ncbi:MAG: plasmid recombination protein [Firmicutes bacterium]|nr:plasmid recombination protein [Bacillota bacterium]
MMKRTISAMIGKGSTTHNNRDFIAENVDQERTKNNITFCNEDIKDVYHELFDDALEKYNAKQTRKDRMIDDYYEKIRTGKQEKLFHEIILQIGDKDNMSAGSENGELAKKILDKYMQGFQERNPNLRVFSAHIHMDEATPHLHIDFVPFTTGSKRGLETRVSLKKALEAQGFVGKGKSDTEWNRWVESEKEKLAEVMLEHGIEWEQKGEHREHLSVLEYKREQRTQELAELTEQTQEKVAEAAALDKQIEKTKQKKVNIESIDKIEVKPVLLTPSRVSLEKTNYETLSTAAKKYYAQEKKESKLQKLLDAANRKIDELKAVISSLREQVASLTAELSKYKSVRNRLNSANLERENEHLRSKIHIYEEVISENKLWHLFGKVRGKTHTKDDAR